MIRNFVFILLFTFCLPLPALAVLTFGAAPQKGALIHSERQAAQFAAALQDQLGEELKVRIFPDEATLHTWLNRYQQVDIAAFSKSYVQGQPAGEFFQLNGTAAFGSLDPIVLRQGVSPQLLQRVQTAVSSMTSDPAVRGIFQKPKVIATVKPASLPRQTAVEPPAVVVMPAPGPTTPEPLPEPLPVTLPPPTTSDSSTPRIWLGEDKSTPQSVENEISLSSRPSTTPPPEHAEAVVGEDQPSRDPSATGGVNKPSPAPKTFTSADKGKLFAGMAVAIIAVTGGFLYLRPRRQSAPDTIALAPRVGVESSPTIITAAQGKSQNLELNLTKNPLFSNASEEAQASAAAPQVTAIPAWDDEKKEPQQTSIDAQDTGEETPPLEIFQKNEASQIIMTDAELETGVPPSDELECLGAEKDPLAEETPERLAETEGETPEPEITGETNEPWRLDEIEPRHLDVVEKAFAQKAIETPAEKPEPLAASEGETPEPEITDKETDTGPPWESAAIDPEHIDAAEYPFGENVQIFSLDHSSIELSDALETLESEALAPRSPLNAVDRVTYGGSEEDSFAPLNATDLTSLDDEPEDTSGFDSVSLNDKETMPQTPAPDYRSFFDTVTDVGLAEETPETAPLQPHSTRQRPAERLDRGKVSLRMKGELGPSQVPALLKLISGQKKAGTLVVQTHMDEKRIYFRKGKIAGATSINRAKQAESGFLMNKFGSLLIRQGLISEQERDHAMEICSRQSGRRIGEVLMETCQLSYQELKDALREQVLEIVFSLILFPSGSFEYISEHCPIPTDEDLTIGIDELLKEATHQAEEWRELRKMIPSLETVMEYKGSSRKKLQNARMASHQELILSLINGKRTVQEICNKACMLELEVYRFLFLMVKARVISPIQKNTTTA